MSKRAFLPLLLNPQHWWLPLSIIVIVSIAGVVMIGVHTYTEAPPIPTYVAEDGAVVISHDEILRGQLVFQRYGLMDYGTMFGDGALRGADFTAEALHAVAMSMMKVLPPDVVRAEIKRNRYDAATNTVRLSAAQAQAARDLAAHIAFPSLTTGMTESERHEIAAFCFFSRRWR